ncbi:MAG: PilZ domain-containing protein [Fimbriimonas sp.]
MEIAETGPDYATVGTDLTAVFYDEGRPRAERAHVYAEAPFYVSCRDGVAERAFPGDALLLWTRGEEVFMADARATHAEQMHTKTLVEMQIDDWRPIDDRRRYPRHTCTASVALRRVVAGEEVVEDEMISGRTRDLSMSGAFVQVPPCFELGDLVEFHAVLAPGVVVRALSVIARRKDDQGGVGVAFLEFLGDGDNDLERFLARVA